MAHRRGDACILHIDLDAFYASVEQVKNEALRGRPVLVGGGVVLAASYEARRFGISAPMGIRQALALCPQAVVVEGSFEEYSSFSKQVFEIVGRFSPAVEQISIDEAFVDVCGARRHFGDPETIAHRLRRQVREETGLALSVGIASTKFLAKVGSRVAKPDGLVAVPAGDEIAFLHPLPVQALWGVGPKSTARLHERGVFTVGEMAAVPVATLARWFGPGAGRHLHALSWNLDPRPVITERRAGSMGAQSALGRGTEDREELARVLLRLADRVARRLRAKGRAGRTITVRIRDPDLHVISRALTLPAAVASTAALHRIGLHLLDQAHPEGRVTLLGISVSKLDELGALRLELAVEGDNPTRPGSPSGAAQLAADRAVDLVRERFGKEAAGRASLLLHPHRGVPDGFRELAER